MSGFAAAVDVADRDVVGVQRGVSIADVVDRRHLGIVYRPRFALQCVSVA